jgi:hypothetical protein
MHFARHVRVGYLTEVGRKFDGGIDPVMMEMVL